MACCAHAMPEVMGSQTHPSTNDLNLFFKGKGWNPTSTSHSTQSLNLFLTVRGGIPHRPATALKNLLIDLWQIPNFECAWRARPTWTQNFSKSSIYLRAEILPRHPPAASCWTLPTDEIFPATFILIISIKLIWINVARMFFSFQIFVCMFMRIIIHFQSSKNIYI